MRALVAPRLHLKGVYASAVTSTDGPDQAKPPSKLTIALCVLAIIFLAAASGLCAGYLLGWSNWQDSQFAAIGTWLAAFATAGTAIVAVVQTMRANEQARRAEQHSADDIEGRRWADLRAREYLATEAILKAISKIVSEVYSYRDYSKSFHGVWKEAHEPPSEGPLLRQRDLRLSCNASVTDIRLALLQLETRTLYSGATPVMAKAAAVGKALFPQESVVDIDSGITAVNAVNEAGNEFQKIADIRFRRPHDLPVDELPLPPIPAQNPDHTSNHIGDSPASP
ncbi:hypothetical protein E143388_07925 [Rhodococcus opacus]|nr:hypothetical protein E143388_07925 [Rhodococcus opacus]